MKQSAGRYTVRCAKSHVINRRKVDLLIAHLRVLDGIKKNSDACMPMLRGLAVSSTVHSIPDLGSNLLWCCYCSAFLQENRKQHQWHVVTAGIDVAGAACSLSCVAKCLRLEITALGLHEATQGWLLQGLGTGL